MKTREYFKDIGYKPFLFYVVFGVKGEKLQVSKSRHHVDVFPDDLEIHSLCRTNHADYINGFFEGTLGKILKEANRELYECIFQKNGKKTSLTGKLLQKTM